MAMTPTLNELSIYLRDSLLDDNGALDPSLSHLVFGEQDLRICLQTAIGVLGLVRSDEFRKRFTMETVAGSLQDAPPGCEECLEVLGTLKDDGSLDTSSIRKVKDSMTLGLPLCKDASGSVGPTEVRVVEGDGTSLIFNPPAKAGTKVVMMCSTSPSIDDVESLSPALKSATFLLAVSLAYGQDIESVQARERSDSFWARGMTLVGITRRDAQDRIRRSVGGANAVGG